MAETDSRLPPAAERLYVGVGEYCGSRYRRYSGTRDELIGAGLAREGWFPGERLASRQETGERASERLAFGRRVTIEWRCRPPNARYWLYLFETNPVADRVATAKSDSSFQAFMASLISSSASRRLQRRDVTSSSRRS
jgi:hypothetical protein